MNNFIDTLNTHLKKYPLMQAEDIYKLAYQFYFGPAHFIDNQDKAYSYLLEEAKNETSEELEIIDVGDYYRYPLINDEKYLKSLFEAFCRSAVIDNQPIDGFVQLLDVCIEYLNSDELLSLKEKMQELGYPAISHSKIYKDNYHPHYRLINKKYAYLINYGN